MVKRSRDSYELLVVGGGIAGLMAAMHATRLGMKVLLIEGDLLFGGQVANVEAIDGVPGLGEVSGTALSTHLVDELRASGGTVLHETALMLVNGEDTRQLKTGSGMHSADAVIVATGARLRRLGVPGEEALTGRGVSQCATCDGAFFRGQDVVVVGGGDAALQEALVLAPICRTVTLLTRSGIKAKRSYVERITACENVRFLWSSSVEAVLGDGSVSAVRIRNHATGGIEEVGCTGLFPFIGSEPNTEWLPEAFTRDSEGRIETQELRVRGTSGIYAIGAARSGYNGQIASAVGEGVAAVEAIARERRP